MRKEPGGCHNGATEEEDDGEGEKGGGTHGGGGMELRGCLSEGEGVS